MSKKYIVHLTKHQRIKLESLIKKGRVLAYKRLHAEILLKADHHESEGDWTDQKISKAFNVSTRTVERVRQRLVKQGLEAALSRTQQTKVRSYKLNEEQEELLVQLSNSLPPEGHKHWTLRLLAERMVELEHVPTVSYETVRRILKKREGLEKKKN